MVLIRYKDTVMPVPVICADYPNWHNGILIPYHHPMMRVDWRRGSDADLTQFFIAVHSIKTLRVCLEKPSAI